MSRHYRIIQTPPEKIVLACEVLYVPVVDYREYWSVELFGNTWHGFNSKAQAKFAAEQLIKRP